MKKRQIYSFLESLRLQSEQETPDHPEKMDASLDADLELMRELWSKLPPADDEMDLPENEQQCDAFQWMLKGYEAAAGPEHKSGLFTTGVHSKWLPTQQSSGILAFATITLIFAATLFMQQRQMLQYQDDMRDLKQWFAQSSYDKRPSTDRIGEIIANHQFSYASLDNSQLGPEPFETFQNQQNDIKTLFETLRSDPSSNVRLIALQSLRTYLSYPAVRNELVSSIPFQSSDIVLLDITEAFLEQATEEELAPFWRALKASKLESRWIRKIQLQHSTHI